MKQRTRRFGVVALAVVLVAATAAGAWAVTVTAPSASPFTVPGDGSGNPQFFTVTATGFAQNEAVYVQQCDGVSSSSPGYSVGEHCDLASGNSPVNANASGSATFSASDANQRLNVFKGSSPQGLFNCLSPNDPSPANGQPDFRNCQVRVSGGTPSDTTEQAFFTIALPDAISGTTTTTTIPSGGGPTNAGDCGGSLSLLKLASTTKGVGLGDQTTQIKVSGALAKDQNLKTPIAGNCSGVTRTGDAHVPQNGPLATLTPKAQATALLGNSSCANGDTAPALDASAGTAWPENGKITWTFTQTYTDLITLAVKPYKMQADIAVLGFKPASVDVVDVGGIVLSGVNAGASVSGSIWVDPVALTHGANGYNTGYELDLASVAGCSDGTAGNANILQELSGGGGGSSTSLLGDTATGLHFEFGE